MYMCIPYMATRNKESQSKRGESDNFFPYMESRLKIKKSKKVDRGGHMRRMGWPYAYGGTRGGGAFRTD